MIKMKKTLILIGIMFAFLAIFTSNVDASYYNQYYGYPLAVGAYAYNYPHYGGYGGFGVYGGCGGYYGYYSNCGGQGYNLMHTYFQNSPTLETSQNNLKSTYDFISSNQVKYDFPSNSYDYNPVKSYGFQGYNNYQQPY